MNRSISQKGQSMLEVLVALGSAVIIITAITMAVITSLSNGEHSENQNKATRHAQAGIEYMRQFRDSDNTAFFQLPERSYCFDKGEFLRAETCTRPNLDTYIRNIRIRRGTNSCNSDDPSLAITEVTASVSWTDGKCRNQNPYCHTVSLVSCLSDLSVSTQL